MEEEEGRRSKRSSLDPDLLLPSPQQVEAATCPSSLYELCVEFTLFFGGGRISDNST